MLNSAVNYPYPLLRSKPEDYQHSIFEANIHVSCEKKGFRITVEYHVNNEKIESMISKRILSFALQIQCVSTWYRDFKVSESKSQNIFVPSKMVHDRVDLCPCIIANERIDDFFIDDFSEDYKGILYSIDQGEVVGIGERKKFDAVYKDDIIKKSESIVHFYCDEHAGKMSCEFENDTIGIRLPKKQWEQYNKIGKSEPWKVDMLNAIYVTPVIVQAIMEINQDEYNGGHGDMSSRAWYKTLKLFIKRAAKNDENKYKTLVNDPISTAQLLLDNNSAKALELVSNVVKG